MPPAGGDPIECLRDMAHAYRAMAWRFPNLRPLVVTHGFDAPAAAVFAKNALGLVRAAVADDALASQFFRVLKYYLIGAALAETTESRDAGFELGLECLLAAMRASADVNASPPVSMIAPKPTIRPKR